MQPGCLDCFESLCMGLKHSKSRRSGGYEGVTVGGDVSATFLFSVTEFNTVHSDSVTCVDAFGPGTCVTGSKDHVNIACC